MTHGKHCRFSLLQNRTEKLFSMIKSTCCFRFQIYFILSFVEYACTYSMCQQKQWKVVAKLCRGVSSVPEAVEVIMLSCRQLLQDVQSPAGWMLQLQLSGVRLCCVLMMTRRSNVSQQTLLQTQKERQTTQGLNLHRGRDADIACFCFSPLEWPARQNQNMEVPETDFFQSDYQLSRLFPKI